MFIKEFLKNPIKTGAIVQSSRQLTQLIVDKAQLADKRVIVEFGSGTGAFTREIIEKKPEDALFFSIEQNETFVQITRHNVAEATVYHDSAENIHHFLQMHGQSHCDCIISGLPWAAFTRQFQRHLLEVTYEALAPGGVFLTFAYHHGSILPPGLRFKALLGEVFEKVERSEMVWRNVPPAFIYRCTKKA